ncbi:protein artichoke [Dendroctonus ponderosae]|uniref:protein artichoke n=1 Tax=Dendroctonus ponderosae TaxID=77166 RepID=UPI0020358A3D|nr:protein artichoke [Dendroctonus ponderosae]
MKNTFSRALLIVMTLKICEGKSTCTQTDNVYRSYRIPIPNERNCLSCLQFDYRTQEFPRWLCSDDSNYSDDIFYVMYETVAYGGQEQELKIEATNFTRYSNENNFQFSSVRILDISQNNIGFIPEAFFLLFPHVWSLDISKNNLTSISRSDFIYLENLQVLDLSFNRITHLSDAFANVVDLFDIDLSHNKISNIPKDLFQSHMHLENLNLSYNEMVRFEMEMPKYSKFILNELDLSFNKLENVSINKDVKRLIISYNKLTEFSLSLGENFVSLNLSHNRLVKIDDHSMLNAVNVADIDLSYNKLQRLPTGSFRNQQKLSSLDISNNLLAESSFGSYNNWATFFYSFAMLKSVDLNNNMWICSELKDIMHMLKSRSIDVIQGNVHNSSNILGVKCIETYRNNTSRFNESESEIGQTIGLDILTQVLENIDPHFKRLEETVLNHTSSNLQKINTTIINMDNFKTNISTVINDILANISKTNVFFENFPSNNSSITNNEKIDYQFIKDRVANVEEQIKSIAAYQQNSEKVVHPNSETADKILAELWSRLVKNMTQLSPKTTDSEISGAKNTAKLTVHSDKQVAESKEILERISEGTNAVSGMVVQNLLLSFILGALLYNLFIKIKGKRRNAPRDELNLVQA